MKRRFKKIVGKIMMKTGQKMKKQKSKNEKKKRGARKKCKKG